MRWFYSVVLLFLYVFTQAQEPYVVHYQEENGLADNEIYDLYFDDDGFLWIAGNGGLDQFNGQWFTHYPYKQGPRQAKGNISQDQDGNIWCIDFRGNIFRQQGDSLIMQKQTPPKEAEINTLIPGLYGGMWSVGFLGSGLYLNDSMLFYPQLKGSHAILGAGIMYVIEDSLWAYDLNGNPVKDFEPRPSYYMKKTRKNLAYSPLGILAISKMERSLYRFSLGREARVDSFTLVHNGLVMRCFGDTLLVGSRQGLDVYFLSDTGLSYYGTLLDDQQISAIAKDASGQLWVGTLNSGLYRIFDLSLVNYALSDDPFLYPISLCHHQKELYIGSSKGTFHRFRSGVVETLDGEIKGQEGYSIVKLSDDTLLFSSDQTRYFIPSTKELGPWIEQMVGSYGAKRMGQKLLISHWSSINVVKNQNLPGEHLLGGRFRSFLDVWNQWIVASEDLAIAFSYDSAKVSLTWDTLKIHDKPVGAKELLAIKGYLGLISPGMGKMYFFNEAHEVSDSLHLATPWGEVEEVWSNGLEGYLICSNALVHLTSPEKVQERAFPPGFSIRKAKGAAYMDSALWVIHRKGLLKVPIHQLKPLQHRHLFVAQALEISQQRYELGQAIELQYGDYDVKLDYKYKDFGHVTVPLYYSIQGQQESTKPVLLQPGQRFLYVSNLPVGNSTLRIKDGLGKTWFEQKITVHLPYWQRVWFLVTLVLAGVMLTSSLFILRIKTIQRRSKERLDKAELLNQLRSSNLTSLKAQLNPHFMFNALSSIQFYILSKEPKEASHYLGRFAKLMRKTLMASNQHAISLQEEIEVLTLYLELESIRFEGSFFYAFEIDPKLNLPETFVPSMLLQPFAENAIKHGLHHKKGERNLMIRFMLQQDKLRIEIEDDGIGREAANQIKDPQLNASFSTQANQKRLELLNEFYNTNLAMVIEDLYKEDGRPAGTKVILTIPNTFFEETQFS